MCFELTLVTVGVCAAMQAVQKSPCAFALSAWRDTESSKRDPKAEVALPTIEGGGLVVYGFGGRESMLSSRKIAQLCMMRLSSAAILLMAILEAQRLCWQPFLWSIHPPTRVPAYAVSCRLLQAFCLMLSHLRTLAHVSGGRFGGRNRS